VWVLWRGPRDGGPPRGGGGRPRRAHGRWDDCEL